MLFSHTHRGSCDAESLWKLPHLSLSLSNRSSPALTHSCLLPRKQILRTYLHACLHHHLNLGLQMHYSDCTISLLHIYTLSLLNLCIHTHKDLLETNTFMTNKIQLTQTKLGHHQLDIYVQSLKHTKIRLIIAF